MKQKTIKRLKLSRLRKMRLPRPDLTGLAMMIRAGSLKGLHPFKNLSPSSRFYREEGDQGGED